MHASLYAVQHMHAEHMLLSLLHCYNAKCTPICTCTMYINTPPCTSVVSFTTDFCCVTGDRAVQQHTNRAQPLGTLSPKVQEQRFQLGTFHPDSFPQETPQNITAHRSLKSSQLVAFCAALVCSAVVEPELNLQTYPETCKSKCNTN